MLGAVLLAAGAEAVEAQPVACSATEFVPSLQVLDAGQSPGKGESLRGVFEADARIAVYWGDQRHERGLEAFIDEIAQLPVPSLAYAFESPTITCTSAFRATLVRRGCYVGQAPGGPLVEVSETETMDLVRTLGAWRIEKLVTMSDAIRMDGKVVFDERPFFVLPACERAARDASTAR